MMNAQLQKGWQVVFLRLSYGIQNGQGLEETK
jgi:hypothetical protein